MNVTLPSIRWGLLYGLILTNAVSGAYLRWVHLRGAFEKGARARILVGSCKACVDYHSQSAAGDAEPCRQLGECDANQAHSHMPPSLTCSALWVSLAQWRSLAATSSARHRR